MKAFKLLLTLLLVFFIYQSKAQHLILLEKIPQTYPQWFLETTAFPKIQIEAKYKEGFEITRANYKNKRWFIAMIKKNAQARQEFIHNPSSAVLNARKNDGYTVIDFCIYYDANHKQQTFYVLNKVSTQPVNDTYLQYETISSSISYVDYPIYLIGMIHSGTRNNLRIQSIRTYPHPGHPNQIMLGTVIAKVESNPAQQIWASRPEYPTDYINDRKNEGYKVKAMTYSNYDKMWIIVMEKNIDNRQWLFGEYNADPATFKLRVDEGYTITGVF